jgi:hypothetical protein
MKIDYLHVMSLKFVKVGAPATLFSPHPGNAATREFNRSYIFVLSLFVEILEVILAKIRYAAFSGFFYWLDIKHNHTRIVVYIPLIHCAFS